MQAFSAEKDAANEINAFVVQYDIVPDHMDRPSGHNRQLLQFVNNFVIIHNHHIGLYRTLPVALSSSDAPALNERIVGFV